MLRVGIVGAGGMGLLHGKLLKKNADVHIAGITDIDAEKARGAAAALGTKAFPDIGSLMGSGLDMLFIAVPNTKHAELAVQALEKGLHVFVEKPLSVGMEGARAVAAAQKKAGKLVFVGLNRRFAPVYAEAKSIIGNAGFRPSHINIIQNDGDMLDPPWLTDIGLTGGFLYDTTVHFFDMARYLLGEIVELRAFGKAFCYPIPDDYVIQLRFAGGASGVITTCGHATWISPFERVQAVGDHQCVITEELDRISHSPGLGAAIESKDFSKLEHNDKWGYARMHRHIFNVLKNGDDLIIGLEDGIKSVEIIEACCRSAENNGGIVTL